MKMLSVQEVADMRGVRRETVWRAIQEGRLNGQQVGRSWIVFDDEKLAAYHPVMGRQRISPLRCPGCGRSVVRIEKTDQDGKMYQCIRCKRRWTEEQIKETNPSQ
jgi:excisionase family DNA binding protein